MKSWYSIIKKILVEYWFRRNKHITAYDLKDEKGKLIKSYKDMKKQAFSYKARMKWNIYDPGKPIGEHIEKFHKTNILLKKNFMYVAALIGKKIMGKYFNEPLKDEWHNKNLLIFDAAFEKSLYEWYRYYRIHTKKADPGLVPESLMIKTVSDFFKENNHYRDLKKLFLHLVKTDSAAKEMFNILMHNITQGMNESYRGQKVAHLFYTDKDCHDVDYLVIGSMLDKKINTIYAEPVKVGELEPEVVKNPLPKHKAERKIRSDRGVKRETSSVKTKA